MSNDAIADIDVGALIAALAREGAVSLPLIGETTRRRLLAAARERPYRRARDQIGEGDRRVRQDMELRDRFEDGDPFHRLAARLGAAIERGARRLVPYPFATPFRFDDLMLQRYRPGSLGITPHRDGLRYLNLICLITLAGSVRFAVCDDRAGANPRPLDAAPGRAIFMIAPGFGGGEARPFHFVDQVTSERVGLGLRQKRTAAST